MAEPRDRRPRLTVLSWDEFAAAWAGLHGGVDPRRAAPPLRLWLRGAYLAGRVLGRLRVPADAVTFAGLVCAVLTPISARSAPLVAALLVALASAADSCDGAVAVVTGRTSAWGYVYDSVIDRLAEACWLLALWLLGAPAWLALGCGALGWLQEYVRARAVGAGLASIEVVSVAEKPTRSLVALLGLLLAGLLPASLRAGTVTAAVAIGAVLGVVGLGQVLFAVHASLRRP